MLTFPALSITPLIDDWSEEKAFDPTIESKAEGGYRITRPRCTRVPKTWNVTIRPATDNDKSLVESFEDSVGVGADIFQWTNPKNSQVYQVRFLGKVKYRLWVRDDQWEIKFALEQV